MKRNSFFILFLFTVATAFSQQYFDTVQLRKSVEFMSADDKMGRLPGSDGSQVVSEYILAEFKNAGLVPLCSNGYQHFSYIKGWQNTDSCAAWLDDKELVPYLDFAPVNYFHTCKAGLEAEVVFVGNGEGVNWKQCTGKWVLLLEDENIHRTTASHMAIIQGAGGIIVIDTTDSLQYEYSNVLRISTKKSTTLGPVVKISPAVADSLLAKKNLSLSKILAHDSKEYCIPLGVKFKAYTTFAPNEVMAKNVVAVLEGSDPGLKNEFIVVGGHYDHVGFTERISKKTGKMRTYIYNGADDNASGTTAVVELAKKYASQAVRPKRSIVFVAFDAEEEGLIGSAKFFNECLPFDTSQVKAMVNLDMVGRYDENKGLKIIGANTSKEGEDLLEDITANCGLKVNMPMKSLFFASSDHANFYRYGIPVFFFNTETHKDYHRVSDEVEKIDFASMRKIILIVDKLIDDLANRKKNLRFTKIK